MAKRGPKPKAKEDVNTPAVEDVSGEVESAEDVSVDAETAGTVGSVGNDESVEDVEDSSEESAPPISEEANEPEEENAEAEPEEDSAADEGESEEVEAVASSAVYLGKDKIGGKRIISARLEVHTDFVHVVDEEGSTYKIPQREYRLY